ncbi:hypothetical protein ACOMHN_014796 [Nucella lapillus]
MQRGSFVHRLVEKPGATTTASSTTTSTTTTTTQRPSLSQDAVTWSERGGGGGGGQTQYIRRLVDLRDDLLSQEETALARAVERLRLHSLNNKDVSRYRLKLKDPGVGESPRGVGPSGTQQNPHVPRPMMTTLEKFRLMRPKRHPPALLPLQGKQLIESSSVSNGSSPGESNSGSTEDMQKSDPSAVQHKGDVEDTVKANLQRLMYPSSSIPNIGRKALRRHESLEPKTQQLQHVRHKMHRPSRPILVSPFRLQLQEGGDCQGEGGRGGGVPGSDRRGDDVQEDASSSPRTPPLPPAHKMGMMIDGDRLDMEKLNQYYYVYCLPDDSLEEDGKNGPRFPLTQGGGGRLHSDGSKPRRTHSERPYNCEKTDVKRPYSDRAGHGGVMASEESSSNPSQKRTMGKLTGPDRISLPVIRASEDGFSPAYHGKGKLEAFVTETDVVSSSVEIVPGTGRRKRHIVIDMPPILFSSTTPDVTREPTLAEADSHSDHPETLTKGLEQNEVRGYKELDTLPVPES